MTDQNINSTILDRAERQTGMTVPDGYFENFAARMADSLPRQPWEDEATEHHVMPSRSLWQKLRPYVYMAAMFAGIWLMMNITTLVGTGGNGIPAPAPAPTVAQLVESGESEYTDYAVENFDRLDLYDDLYASGFNPVSLSYDN